ncbi:unnamed protein product, partial [Ilex paraguariensis]
MLAFKRKGLRFSPLVLHSLYEAAWVILVDVSLPDVALKHPDTGLFPCQLPLHHKF